MKRIARLLGFASLPFLLLVAAQAQTVDTINPALRGRIDNIVTQVLRATGVPSASIAIVQHGKIVYTHAYGLANLQPPVPATTAMRYPIGSISKQFTAAAILLLQQEGKLSLNDPVGKYIPHLTRGDEVTIGEILSQTSGYQDYWPEDYEMPLMQYAETPQQILDTWAKRPLDFNPGTKWEYSNTNYVIAGEIVQKVSGEPLMQFLTQHIFAPLGMKSVVNFDQGQMTAPDATGYSRYALGPLRPSPKEGKGWMFGAGELAMTAQDLALWDQSLLAQSVLKPAGYKEMFTPVRLPDGKNTHYGLGVEAMERDGHLSIEHSGEVSGFVSDNMVLVNDGAAVVVLTNQDAVDAASAIAQYAAPLVAGYEPALSPVEQQALEIYRGLQKGHIDRSLLSPNLNAYFNAQALADFKSSLGPLGEPLRFHLDGSEQRGGMTFRMFTITYPGKRLLLTTYSYANGKLEQYLVAPAN
jgi:CubicO group peptidase (beta-lactamase class C family)